MKKAKIIGVASEICWWKPYVGQTFPVLDVYEKTGYIQIQYTYTEPFFEDQPIVREGWIPPQYVEITE